MAKVQKVYRASDAEFAERVRKQHAAAVESHAQHVAEIQRANDDQAKTHAEAMAAIEAVTKGILAEHKAAATERKSQVKRFQAAATKTARKFLNLPDPPEPDQPALPEPPEPPEPLPEPEPPEFLPAHQPTYSVLEVPDDYESENGEHFMRVGHLIAPRGVWVLTNDETNEAHLAAPGDFERYSPA